MAAKIRPVRITRGDVDFHVEFLKLAPSRDFEPVRAQSKNYREPPFKVEVSSTLQLKS